MKSNTCFSKYSFIAALALAFSTTFSASAHAVAVSGQGTWETTLQARDLDGDASTIEAYYDTILGITWLADAFYYGTTTTYTSALSIISVLDINGITGWRLPNIDPVDGTTNDDALVSYIGTEDRGFNIGAPGTLFSGSTASEMAHLFYNTLGNLAYCDPSTSTVQNCNGPQPGWGLTNTGPFQNIQTRNYWFGTPYKGYSTPGDPTWSFVFDSGDQALVQTYSYDNLNVWAVHDGDVGAVVVPLPAALWLFGSGLLGLIGVARNKNSV